MEEVITTIRISNIPSYTNEADFHHWFLFADGFEEAKIGPSNRGNTQTGWAKFERQDQASTAIMWLDQRTLKGCPEGSRLKVELAVKNLKPNNPYKRPHTDMQAQGYSPYASQGANPNGGGASSTLFVGKISPEVAEGDFHQLFGLCEGFERLKYVPPSEGRGGMCFAKFSTPDHAEKARQTVSAFALPSNPHQPLQVTFARNDLDQPNVGGKGAGRMPPAPGLGGGGFGDQGYENYDQGGFSTGGQQAPGGFSMGGQQAPGLGAPSTVSDTMYIGGISTTITEASLVNALATLRGFVRVKFCGEGTAKPFALVLFNSKELCQAAIDQLQGMALPDAPDQALVCQFAKNSLDAKDGKGGNKYMRQN